MQTGIVHGMAGGKLMGRQTLEMGGQQGSGEPGTGICRPALVGGRRDAGPTARHGVTSDV